ncbi:MAG TPA: type IV secretion system DNA-binding domain-containing protein [Solirubrobacteraceae bacterium]
MTHPHHQDGPLSLRHLLRDPGDGAHQLLDTARRGLAHLVGLAPELLAAVLAVTIALVLVGRVRARRAASGGRILEVGVPPDADPDGALLLWSALHDLLRPRLRRLLFGQPHLAWEIAANRVGTAFRMWIPGSVPPGLIERALTAAWPGASVRCPEVASEPLSRAHARVSSKLVLSGPDCFPLGGEDGPDPLGLVLAQLAGLEAGEHAVVQILARPATSRHQQWLLAVARRMRAQAPTSRLMRLVDPFGVAPAARPIDPTVTPDVRAVMEKASRPLYHCLIRITVTAPDRKVVRGRMHAIAGAFAAYEGRVGLRRRHTRQGVEARSLGRRAFLLSVPELAALAHLPGGAALPGVIRAAARRVAPPPAVPERGKPLGITDTGPERSVALSVPDARQHLHVLGATGAGKSTLIARLVLDDARAGRGAVVIDPKGDLVDAILERLTDPLPAPLVLIDPERQQRPVGLNVLHGPDRDLAAEHLVGTFRRIFEQFWGPRTDDILRACVLTLARDPRLTLAEIPTCLTNPAWRSPLTDGLRREDPVLAGFWRWHDAQSEAAQVQAIGPLLNKLRAFLLRKPVRAIVGQEQTTFPLGQVLDHGGLLLARLPKGTLGEETSRLLGALLVARVWQEVLGRSRIPEHARRDAALYVDEVHNYLALPHSFEDLLAEARGYRLSLCLAHQHLGQLPRAMGDALSANARTKLIFTCSPEDARALERHTAPELTAHDLSNLARYQAACRTLADGQDAPAFTLQTTALPAADQARAMRLRTAAERRFGRDPAHIERRLRARQLRVLPGGPHADHPPNQRADQSADRSPDHS